jgi:AcrR family transcriptional regulator
MFLADGFDAVRVVDVAAACGVSEKTVYNYFPTKESLILDRYEGIEEQLRRALGPGADRAPVEAAVDLIAADVHRDVVEWGTDRTFQPELVRRFTELVRETPVLVAAQRAMEERLVQLAAEAMAERAGVNPDDPEPQVAANAILGLWRVQYSAIGRYADRDHTPAQLEAAVMAEVRRAARLIDTGLWSFGMAVQGSEGREQLRLAAESANEARRQVLSAIRQARTAWRQFAVEAAEGRPERHGRPGRGPRGGGRGER